MLLLMPGIYSRQTPREAPHKASFERARVDSFQRKPTESRALAPEGWVLVRQRGLCRGSLRSWPVHHGRRIGEWSTCPKRESTRLHVLDRSSLDFSCLSGVLPVSWVCFSFMNHQMVTPMAFPYLLCPQLRMNPRCSLAARRLFEILL